MAGFDTGFVTVSKKPPPLSGGGDLAGGAVKFDCVAEGLLKLAKGSILGAGRVCVGGGDVVEAKVKLLNASLSPPVVDRCCEVGDCMPPKMSWPSCCGCGCVRGAEAYSDRIDCLRSGLEAVGAAPEVVVALEGLAEGAEGGPPKKSKPRRESPCFCCFGGPAASFMGGGRTLGVSAVLGRAGGIGMSPNKSIFGAGLGIGLAGWLDVEESRCEEERSIFALSCTTFRG